MIDESVMQRASRGKLDIRKNVVRRVSRRRTVRSVNLSSSNSEYPIERKSVNDTQKGETGVIRADIWRYNGKVHEGVCTRS